LAWRIEFDPRAEKDFRKIGPDATRRIRQYLYEQIASLAEPRQRGKALKGQWAEYWRYRIGDYRVVCELRDETLVVLVVRVAHRKEVYR
jgi:mRNA interferase RelE/StbE